MLNHKYYVQIMRGGEYITGALRNFNLTMGLHQTTCSDTPQQNSVAERKNRTLLDITRDLYH